MKNHWKRAFWVLLVVNLVVVLAIGLVIVGLLSSQNKGTTYKKDVPAPLVSSEPVFTVNGNKKQLEAIMNEELQKLLSGNLEATVLINDQVEIKGHLKILGVQIPYSMLFEPKVENNGETVTLNETSVTVGRFALPVSQVLTFIQEGASFPKWVVVQPDKKRLEIHLSGFVIRDQFSIRAQTIDLKNNQLVFNIYRTNGNH